MTVPYVLDLGGNNTFIKDFYAKRIMTLFALPFLTLILFYSFKKKITVNKNIVLYSCLYIIILLSSVLKGNSIILILTDAFIGALPIIFYFVVFKTNFNLAEFETSFNSFLILAGLLVLMGVKLQFSYFSLLSAAYLMFLVKWNKPQVLILLTLPLLLVQSLIGKSALIMLGFLISYFFFFNKELVSRQKKTYLILIPSSLLLILTITFWSKIENTGSYRNAKYFIRNTDLKNLSFKDNSTGHRLFEAEEVLKIFSDTDIITKLIGNGFGATIDLSETQDGTIARANEDITKVRHIHMGIFAVIHRYGILGLSLYILFIGKMIFACRRILKIGDNKTFVLSALYVLIILFDSMISMNHMMSNFLFWLLTFAVLKKNDEIQKYNRELNHKMTY